MDYKNARDAKEFIDIIDELYKLRERIDCVHEKVECPSLMHIDIRLQDRTYWSPEMQLNSHFFDAYRHFSRRCVEIIDDQIIFYKEKLSHL